MATLHLTLLRHGATLPNQQGLRCGGDLDAPLTDDGRRQATQAALRIRELRLPVRFIVTSRLARTVETARIVSRVLQGVEVAFEPAFAERRLGAWNLQPIAATEAALAQGETPPGGESMQDFSARIAAALDTWLPRLHEPALLVASKGIARVLRELTGGAPRQPLGNGELAHFDLTGFAQRRAAACAA
jgi:2,3-bisphosphoglycerate-dependent phosphoglycerate mutase